MPISEEEWANSEDGIAWIDVIIVFLEDNYPLAYSIDELIDELFDLSSLDMDDAIVQSVFAIYVQSLLEYLVDDGRVDIKTLTRDETRANYFRKSK